MEKKVKVGVVLKKREKDTLHCVLTKISTTPTITNKNKIQTKLQKQEIKFAINESTNKIKFVDDKISLPQIQEVVKELRKIGYETVSY